MTREEAIDWLARMKSNTVNHTLEMPLWWNEPLAEALDMAIQALEQESSKPMVEIDLYSVIKQKYIEREVLDKLRTELHATAEMHEDGGYYIRAEWINECFDKYKRESEDI